MSLKSVNVYGPTPAEKNTTAQNQALRVALLAGDKGRGTVAFNLKEYWTVEFEATPGADLTIDPVSSSWPHLTLDIDNSGTGAKITNKGCPDKDIAFSFTLKAKVGNGPPNVIDPVIIPR